MNHYTTITIKRFAHRVALWLCLALLALATQLIAHGGFDHVIGTVVTVRITS